MKTPPIVRALLQSAGAIVWPAFLMAGVLEMLVFAAVDPGEVHGWFRGERIGWSMSAIYSVTFLIFWLVIASSNALTVLLLRSPQDVNRDDAANNEQ